MKTFEEKMKDLADLVTKEQAEYLKMRDLDCPNNVKDRQTSIKPGNKYWKIDVGCSGKFMVEKATEIVYGIKAYGQIHKGHAYGTLDTTDQWYWGEFYPVKKGSN